MFSRNVIKHKRSHMLTVVKFVALFCFCLILKGKYVNCESITKISEALHLDIGDNS